MFDEDLPKASSAEFPRNIENLSISEIDDYIADLKAEITRCEVDEQKKQASAAAADAIFK